LTTGNTSILIDAGISIRALKRILKTYDIEIDQIDAVFVTHDHADHIKAVGNLANEYGKLVYSTEKVHAGINSNYCMTSKLTEEHIRIIQKDVPLQLGNMVITPFDVPHDSSDCVGYKVQAEGVVFCLITDAGHVTSIMEEQVSKANYLVLEANHDEDMLMMGTYPAYLKGRIRGDRGHLCNKESARLIAEHATPILKHVWLCHLSEENNHPELARKTVEGLLRSFGIIPGVDFDLDILKRKSPSDLYELKA
jgi:phosphoribosyl 1,2-cyclic phosphodiesterase